ncbi:ABC transporter ATP-binding protein [Jannaschia sp. LMIT008]|uniref:ABC transporter ATP-binding protein n=1 Tax=Jannaschia maritima TaxID=3032585 RepID=UPI0028120AFE|nr:ABC transporter ATP-binding protein [Jannaschia sp. LMIT008]
MTEIAIRGLRKSFGGVPVLHGVDLDVPSSASVAILGPSGCGKTTLLRLIAGLEEADAGTIALDGRSVAGPGLHVPPEGRALAMVFQSYALWPHMTVAENVGYPLRVAGTADHAVRTHAALDSVRLTPHAARRPAELSGGQQQRTALARALVAEPGLILMDEPLANLDMHLREGMRAEFRRLHDVTGATMVTVTHDQADALSLADLVVVMEAGAVLQVADPETLYARPATRAVARLIGRSAVVEASGGRWRGLRLPGAEDHDGPVAIRPEDVQPGEAPAQVAGRTYLGDRWLATLDIPGSDAIDGRLECYLPRGAPDPGGIRIAAAHPLTG